MNKRSLRLPISLSTGKHDNLQDSSVEETLEEVSQREFRISEIAVTLKQIYGVLTQLLQRTEENSSLPRGTFLNAFNSAAVQNTVYTSNKSAIDGVARGILIGGTGNLTLKRLSPGISPGGSITIGTFPLAGVSMTIPFRVPVQAGDSFSVATDSAANGVVSLVVWVEPIAKTGKELFFYGSAEGQ